MNENANNAKKRGKVRKEGHIKRACLSKYAHTQSENLNVDVASLAPPLRTCAITAMGTSFRRNDFWNLLSGRALLYMIG